MSEVQSEVQDEVVSDADFDAGFTGTPTETPENPQSENQEQQPVEEQEPEEPKYRQITEEDYNRFTTNAAAVDEMRATLGKQVDTAFGKIGGLERVIKQFQESTPAGHAVEITEDDFAELRDEFPELVGPQLKALQRVASKMRGTGQPSQQINGDSLVLQAKTEIATETLAETHPDWRNVVGAPDSQNDYRKWLTSQPQDYQKRVSETYSPVVIGRSIDKFRDHQEQLKKTERRDRFEQAVTPRGEGGHEPPADDDDAFNAGFNGR